MEHFILSFLEYVEITWNLYTQKKFLKVYQEYLTLIPTATKVFWFPTGCAPYVPTFIWLINNKMTA
jgi:hypothetical protein